MTEIAPHGRERSPYPRFLACGSRRSPRKARSISLLSHHCLERFWRPTVTDRPECDPSEDGGSEGWHKMVTTGFADLTHEDLCGWVCFIMSLRSRTPDTVTCLRTEASDYLKVSLDERPEEYDTIADTSDPRPHWLSGLKGTFQASSRTSEAGRRLPRFSPNSLLSLLLHGFGAPAFARNANSLALLMGEFPDGFLTVVSVTAMLYWLRSMLSSAIQSLR